MTISAILKSSWHALPHSVRDNVLLSSIKQIVKQNFNIHNQDTIFTGRTTFPKIIDNLEELDQAIQYASYLETQNQDQLFVFLNSFSFKPSLSISTIDPFSNSYSDLQKKLFESIRMSSYDSQHEALPTYIRETANNPYPYCTKSSELAGKHLITTGYLISKMKLVPNSKILELGAGHGGNTLQLTQLGYDVTVVDISNDFLQIIKRRLKKVNKKAKLIHSDFLDIQPLLKDQKFDAIIFNASFHHCSDHQRMIPLLKNLLSRNGHIYFSHEPINEENPLPWGLRLDGESIFHIRLHGWLELGFKESYFTELLSRNGLKVEKIPALAGFEPLYIASIK